MAITHKLIFDRFIQGCGLMEVARMYTLPLTTVEHVLRIRLADKIYTPPEQLTLEPSEEPRKQLTIAEIYGEIEIK